MPSLQYVGPDTGDPHLPIVAPAAIVQTPPQQSAGAEHVSPTCTQKDEFEQTPLRQSFEQHSPSAEHALPSVLQLVLSGSHVPLVHVPLQHALPFEHAALSGVQVPAQCPPTQLNEQQSVLAAQLPPTGAQLPPPTVGVQVWVAGSQRFEQQSAPPAHVFPVAPHVGDPGDEPPVPIDASRSPRLPPEPPSANRSTPEVAPPQPTTARNPHMTR
jgi:hypothetical protein